VHVESKLNLEKAARRLFGAGTSEGDPESRQGMAALPHDVDDIGRHATRQADRRELCRGKTTFAIAVDNCAVRAARNLESKIAGPDQLGDKRWSGISHERGINARLLSAASGRLRP